MIIVVQSELQASAQSEGRGIGSETRPDQSSTMTVCAYLRPMVLVAVQGNMHGYNVEITQ